VTAKRVFLLEVFAGLVAAVILYAAVQGVLSLRSIPFLAPTPTYAPGEAAIQVAGRYLEAITGSRRKKAEALVKSDAWCSPAGLSEQFDRQWQAFASSETRNVSVSYVDVGGWIAYPPGSESATVAFEYRPRDGSRDWTPACFTIVVVYWDGDDWYICDLMTGSGEAER